MQTNLGNLCFFIRYYTIMALVSAAERQGRRREKSKASDSYEVYKAKNAEYSKKCRLKRTIAFETLKKLRQVLSPGR